MAQTYGQISGTEYKIQIESPVHKESWYAIEMAFQISENKVHFLINDVGSTEQLFVKCYLTLFLRVISTQVTGLKI